MKGRSRRIWEHRRERLRALLRTVRLESGFSQEQLAKKLHQRPQSWVSKSESGERRVDLAELSEICEVLGVDLVEFARRYREML
jgi:transcriptional regulator with XRE-family HTH domain